MKTFDEIQEKIQTGGTRNLSFSDVVLFDDDIVRIKNILTYKKQKITVKNSAIELKRIKCKELKSFLENVEIIDSKIFISSTSKLSKKYIEKLMISNTVTMSTALNYYLSTTENDLSAISNEEIMLLSLEHKDMSNTVLPDNEDFFQLIKEKALNSVILPFIDFSKYNIEGVIFKDCKFNEDSIFNKDFFTQIYQRKLVGCYLPKVDFNEINITNCTFEFVKFHSETKFPKDMNFFKSFNRLLGCELPQYDYRNFNFEDTNFKFCSFQTGSKLPYSCLRINSMIDNSYPKSYAKTLHLFPMENHSYEQVILKYGKHLSETQKALIYIKTYDSIEEKKNS